MKEHEFKLLLGFIEDKIVNKVLKADDGQPPPKTHAEKDKLAQEKKEVEELVRAGIEVFGVFMLNQMRMADALEDICTDIQSHQRGM